MALPDNFSHWEHLQDMLRREHNPLVAKYFKDLGENWEPETKTPRGAIRVAATIDENDTAVMTLIRLYYFYQVLGYGRKQLGIFYGMPAREFQEEWEGSPQIFLYFSQDRKSVPDGLTPVTAEIKFRIPGETSATMNPTKAEAWAKKVAAEFVEGNKGIYLNKGPKIISYYDKKNCLALQIYATNQKEGEDIIKKILKVRGAVFDPNKLGDNSKPKRTSETIPQGTETVYGKKRKKKRWRPTARVQFRYSYMIVDNLEPPIHLVDTTGHHWDAFVRV